MKRGFTLIELLVGVSILAILSVIGLSVFTSAQVKARDGVRKRDLKNIAVTLELYYTQNDQYVPGNGSCEQDAPAMYSSLNSFFPLGGVPKDPLTKSNYCYVSLNNGASFVLYARLENCADPEIVDPGRCQLDMYNFQVFSQDLTIAQVATLAPIPTATPTPAPTSAPTSVPTTVPTIAPTSAPAPVAGDLWADTVLGHIDFNQAVLNEVVPFKVFNPGGVMVDRFQNPQKVYVYDGANSRILGLDLPGCLASGGACSASLVLGQPSGNGYSACNIIDGNFTNYPIRIPPAGNSLCFTPPSQNSPLEGGSAASMAVDSQSNLYVSDFHNNRVLKYQNPFQNDQIADEVWGQDDFLGYKCNKTDSGGDLVTAANLNSIPAPTASSLCMGRNGKFQISFQAGVEIDSQGNLWVADTSNHRVLRFPSSGGIIAKTADLVLGQPGFTTRNSGANLNQMSAPRAVRVLSNGIVLVADYGNNRILRFQAPLVNGMSGTLFGSQFKSPSGIEIDPLGGGVWINDTNNGMLELWDLGGTTVQKVLLKDTYKPDGSYGSLYVTEGSLGLDSSGGVLVSAGIGPFQSVYHFAGPIPNPVAGTIIQPDKNFFYPPDGQNYRSNKGLAIPGGVAVKNDQLIVSDGYKIVFWNGLNSLSNGKPADGVVGVADFQGIDPWGIGRIKADSQNHLWVARKSTVDVYQLPLTSNASPIRLALISSSTTLPVLGGGQISWGFQDHFWDIEPDPSGNYLWVSQGIETLPLHRVFRIRDPLTNPVVDVILGQPNATSIGCNRYNGVYDSTYYTIAYPLKAANTVCFPGSVRIDALGNVWVSDHALEFRGNNRLLEFNASLFSNITSNALFGPNASLVSPDVQAWEPAFNSKNQMVVGYNGQTQPPGFPGIYLNPLQTLQTTATADMYLKNFFSHGYSATFDSNDNLYIVDLNRGKVLVFQDPASATIPTPTPTPFVPLPVFPKMGNLIAYWKMDEASWNGTAGEVRDSSANGNHGTAAGAVITTSKAGLGNAASLNGTSTYIEVPDSAGLDLSGPFTISAWVNPVNPGAESEIIQKGTASDCQNYGLLLPGSRQLTALSSNACSWSYAAISASVALNQWQHIAITYNGTNITYYVNGNGPAKKDSKAWGNIGAVNSGSLVIGGGPAQQAQDFFGGKIDEVGIWNTALTDAEIADLYNGGSGLPLSLNNQNQAVAGVSRESLPGFVQNFLQNIELLLTLWKIL